MTSKPPPTPTDRLADLERWRVDLVGSGGGNGKVGTLRGRVDQLSKLLAAVGLAVLGAIGTAAVALYRAGEQRGAEAAEARWLRAQVERSAAAIDVLEEEVLRLRLGLPPAHPAPGDSQP